MMPVRLVAPSARNAAVLVFGAAVEEKVARRPAPDDTCIPKRTPARSSGQRSRVALNPRPVADERCWLDREHQDTRRKWQHPGASGAGAGFERGQARRWAERRFPFVASACVIGGMLLLHIIDAKQDPSSGSAFNVAAVGDAAGPERSARRLTSETGASVLERGSWPIGSLVAARWRQALVGRRTTRRLSIAASSRARIPGPAAGPR